MSRSCQSATSSSPAMQVAPQDAGQAGQALGGDGVALVGHGRGALLAGREALLDLAHLGALQVAQLDGDQLDRRPDRRAGPQVLGVAVAGDDLRGRHGRQAERGAHVALDEGIDVGVRARPRRRACRPPRPPGPSAAGHGRGPPAGTTAPPSRRTSSARRGCRGCARSWRVSRWRSAVALSVATSPSDAASSRSAASRSIQHHAVSTTSDEVRP